MDPLLEQYESWAYPRPIENLNAYATAGGHDLSDPSRLGKKFWPRNDAPKQLNILVAGCGSNQAAILARANPEHQVVGIDLSEQAIRHHQHLKQQHALGNLHVQQIAVEDASSIGRRFDLIVSTGVLHHLNDPLLGLHALREALAPQGVMSVMLYGRNRRSGVYMVQEALRTLGAGRRPEDVALARDVVQHLPAWHHARQYADGASDLAYDAGFVDTFLNARDRAYTVPEVLALASEAGLGFQGWLDGLYYSPLAVFPAEAAIHDKIYGLPLADQWHIVDLLAQPTATHRFLLCHPGRETAVALPFVAGDWSNVVLHRHPDLVVKTSTDGTAQLQREWQSFTLAATVLQVFLAIDGNRTVGQLLQAVDTPELRELHLQLFAQLVEWDHLHWSDSAKKA